jgi:TolB protein
VRPNAPDGCFDKVRLAPDGRHVAIGGSAEGPDSSFAGVDEGRIVIVDTDTGVTTVVRTGQAGDDAGLGPTIRWLAWTPSGRWLAWQVGVQTWIVSSDGTSSRPLPGPGGWPTWSPDDSRVAIETADDLYVGAGNGVGVEVVGPSESIRSWSGDGSQYTFIRDGDVWVRNADGSDLRNMTEFEFGGASEVAFSPDGETLAVVQQARVLWLVDRDGARRRVDLGPDVSLEFVDLHWSPDGTRVALTSYTSAEQLAGTLYLVSIDASPTVKIADAWNPVWAPDGRYLAFLSARGGATRIDVANADGSGRRSMTDDTIVAGGDIAWVPLP